MTIPALLITPLSELIQSRRHVPPDEQGGMSQRSSFPQQVFPL
jgi:hypothetical protein